MRILKFLFASVMGCWVAAHASAAEPLDITVRADKPARSVLVLSEAP